MSTVDSLDVEQLAAAMCGCNEDEERDEIEASFIQKFDIDLDKFESLLGAMLPMMTIGISPLTEKAYVGFAESGAWHLKKDASNEFISSVVEWLGGNEIEQSGKGRQRDVIANGKKEFEITIVKE